MKTLKTLAYCLLVTAAFQLVVYALWRFEHSGKDGNLVFLVAASAVLTWTFSGGKPADKKVTGSTCGCCGNWRPD